MKKVELPNEYQTDYGATRRVIKRGHWYNLESEGKRFHVRQRLWTYLDAVNGEVEQTGSRQDFERFPTLAEAEQRFNQLEAL